MQAPQDFQVKNQIIEMSTNKLQPTIHNIYRETLRELLSVFGNIYYIDGNGNRLQITCVHGDQERMVGKLKQDNTLILPIVSVSEKATTIAEDRQRDHNVLINESYWDPIAQKAVRILSLSPRAVNLTYEISIWSKYKADMDMIRSTIFTMFNPALNLRTKFSDYTKVFIESGDSDMGSMSANDKEDRIIQKSFTLSAETYIPMPKFRYTNTGKIERFMQEYEIFEVSDSLVSGTPLDSFTDNSKI
tara:strand:+ start:70273 stop:71010 length:738 start_codon:yes stop_codon:yes gene_type:complete